jgi:hypothetical protein
MNTKKLTVIQAALTAINAIGKASTADEIFDYIVRNNLYEFNAKDPQAILKSALRRHSAENTNESKKSTLILKKVGGNKFDRL